MIRTLIIEDEQSAATRLEKLLTKADPEISVSAILDSVESSVKWLNENPPPDLLILDIQLGDGLSFDIFRQVNIECFVIFTTAYDEYAIKAFELNSVDYLLKPIDESKLRNSIAKFRKMSSFSQYTEWTRIISLIEGQKKNYKKRFVVIIGDKIKVIDVKEIAFFYTLDGNNFLCTSDNRHYPLDFSLDHLEDILDPEPFFRINRQYIVHFSAIERILTLSKSRIKIITRPETSEPLLVSTGRTPEFRKWLDK